MPPTWSVGPAAERSSRSRRRPSLAVPVDQVVDQVRSTARTDRLGVVPEARPAVWPRDRTRHAVGPTTQRDLVRNVLLAGVFGLLALAIVLLALLLRDGRGAAPLVIQAPSGAVTAPPPAPTVAPRPSVGAPPSRPAAAKTESRGRDDESDSSGGGGSSTGKRPTPGELARDMAREWTGWSGQMPGFSPPGLP